MSIPVLSIPFMLEQSMLSIFGWANATAAAISSAIAMVARVIFLHVDSCGLRVEKSRICASCQGRFGEAIGAAVVDLISRVDLVVDTATAVALHEQDIKRSRIPSCSGASIPGDPRNIAGTAKPTRIWRSANALDTAVDALHSSKRR